MTKWTDIAERAQAATGPDRQFDWNVMVFADGKEPTEYRINGAFIDQVPRYTASVDAVLALIAEKLPDWWPSLTQHGRGWQAYIYAPPKVVGVDQRCLIAATPALALLTAFALAMDDQEEPK